jgi:hypothetical protein
VERIPKMIRSKLSGMIKSIYQKEAVNAKLRFHGKNRIKNRHYLCDDGTPNI